EERRVDLSETLDDLGGVRLVRHGDALVEAGDLQDAGEDVRQREEDEGAAVGDERLLEALVDRRDHAAEAAVQDLAALGAPRGAGRVDQAAQVVETGGERGLLEPGVADVGAGRAEL